MKSMRTKYISFLLLGLSFFTSNAQEEKLSQEEDDFQKFAYSFAIEGYEEQVLEGTKDIEVYKKLGDANFFNSKYEVAAKWYRGLFFALGNQKMDPEYIHRYSISLKSLDRYDEADNILKTLKDTLPEDLRLKKLLAQPNYLENIKKVSNRYKIDTLIINSEYSDFAPSYYLDEGIVFASSGFFDKKPKNIHDWNSMPFLDLFHYKETGNIKLSVSKLKGDIISDAHESSACFTKDGSTVYFTRNNYKDGEFIRDSTGISRLKIYKATYSNLSWNKVEELPFNNDAYSTANPCLNVEENKLYFTSDMPGTFGQSDIFYVTINEDGSFGEPVNCGPEINTEGRETFPFIAESGTLFFASDGHPGLGGLDIYAAKTLDNGKLKVMNIGEPVNSEYDDFSYIIKEKDSTGYFASNRIGGDGSDDIYGFKEKIQLDFSCKQDIAGIVTDYDTEKNIAFSKVQLLGANDVVLDEQKTSTKGTFNFDVFCDEKIIKLNVIAEGYSEHILELDLTKNQEVTDLNLRMIGVSKAAEFGTDLGIVLGISNLPFEDETAFISPDTAIELNKLYAYMYDNPDITVQIRQHTDSRGNAFQNTMLARRRAENIKEYLISTGIKSDRMTVIGVGEAEIQNKCIDGVQCTEAEHNENNRTEFVVLR